MVNKVIHKRSIKKGSLPTGTTLDYGEIAVNYNSIDPFLSIRTTENGKTDCNYAKFIDETAIDTKLNDKLKTIQNDIDGVNDNIDEIVEGIYENEEVVANALNVLNTALEGKSDTGHTHDDRYYTETEIDNKLKGVSDSIANRYGFGNVKVGDNTIEADANVDTLTLVAGSNISITTDATNDKITIATTGLSKEGHTHTISATATDDDIVILTGTNGTNGVTYDAKHKTYLSSAFASGAADKTISGSAASGSFKVPDIAVDVYGHVTGATDRTISITMPTIPTALKNPESLTIQKNGTTLVTYDGSSAKTANITVPTKLSDLSNDLADLTVGSKTYDGSSAVTITASDLGLGAALKYCGITTTALTDGATTNPVVINSKNHTATAGCVVFYGDKEFVFNGSNWELLGAEATYKVVQSAVSSPSASGNAAAFIDTISQDANGKITATKKNVRSATTGQTGIVQLYSGVDSTSETLAATPKAVKTAYNLAASKWKYDEATIKAVKVNSAKDADTVGGLTVLTAVPANAKFTDTDTHYTTHMYLGASTATTDSTSDVSNPYIRLFDNSTAREDIQVSGGTNISVKGKNGVITIDGSHNHDGTYLKSHQTIYNLTLNAGAFSAGTFDPNGAASTFNIPTHTSHLTNNSGFVTNDSNLAWGTIAINGGISPVDAALSNIHSANRLAFSNASGITIEYSQNAGSSWTTYSTTDADKIKLVSGIGSSYSIGGRSSTANTVNDQLRVTLNATDMGVYTRPRKLLLNITTNYAKGSKVKVEYATKGAPTKFTTLGTYDISGWSGWNSIPLGTLGTFGGGSTQTSNNGVIRMTFSITGVTSGQSNGLSLLDVALHGDTYWAHPSTLAKTGHLYDYDANKNAVFPGTVIATTFKKPDGTEVSYTDSKVTSVSNHYTPASSTTITAKTSGANNYVTGVTLSADAKGHITAVSLSQSTDDDTKYTLPNATTAATGGVKLVAGDMNGKSHADGQAPSLSHTHSQYQPAGSYASSSHSHAASHITGGTNGYFLKSDSSGKGKWESVTIGNGTITIKENGTSKGSFTLNQTGNTTFELTNTTYSAGDALTLDGTTFKITAADASEICNLLGEGTSPANPEDYIIAQYASGGTTTTTYHRRKLKNCINANTVKGGLGYLPTNLVSASGTVSKTTGTPSVTITTGGTASAQTLSFAFNNIKGNKGDTGPTGPTGPQGYSVGSLVVTTGTGTTATTSVNTADGGTTYYRIKDTNGSWLTGGIAVKNGSKGSTGSQGPQGYSVGSLICTTGTGTTATTSINTSAGATNHYRIKDTNGSWLTGGITIINGSNGSNGSNGKDGAQGPQGPQGYSVGSVVCVTTSGGTETTNPSTSAGATNYYRVKDTAGSWLTGTIAIKNGSNGTNGTNGTDGTDGTNVLTTSQSPGTSSNQSLTKTSISNYSIGKVGDIVIAANGNVYELYSCGASASTWYGKYLFNIKGANGSNGFNGSNGSDGKSVGSVVCVSTSGGTETTNPSTSAGATNYYRVKDTAGSWLTGTIAIKNGSNGTNGTNGAAGKITSVTASVDNNSGTPSVTVTTGGTASAITIDLAFKNLNGTNGTNGANTYAAHFTPSTSNTNYTASGFVKDLKYDGKGHILSVSNDTNTYFSSHQSVKLACGSDTANTVATISANPYLVVYGNSEGTKDSVKMNSTNNFLTISTNASSGKSINYTINTGTTNTTVARGDHKHTASSITGGTNGYCLVANSSGVGEWKQVSASFNGGALTAQTSFNYTGETLFQGDIRLKTNNSNYGRKIYFGDGEYVYLHEMSDDSLEISAANAVTLYTEYGSLYIGDDVEGASFSCSVHASAYYQDSDERLKDFGDEIDVDFEKLKEIPKSYFTWKSDENKVMQLGTSAQKVRELYPEIVGGDDDTTLSVDYAKLSIVALKAIDKLHEENEMLKSIIESMDKRLSELEKKL